MTKILIVEDTPSEMQLMTLYLRDNGYQVVSANNAKDGLELVAKEKPDVVITDPPRAGMHVDVVNKILEMKPTKIVYISCNPSTQARDIALMDELYAVERIQPVDMFPQTHLIENVVLLKLR